MLVQVPMLVGAQGFGFGPVGPLAPQPGPLSAPLCREAGTGVLGKGQQVHRPMGAVSLVCWRELEARVMTSRGER